MIRLPPRSTPLYSSAASDVYKRQVAGVADQRAPGEPCVEARLLVVRVTAGEAVFGFEVDRGEDLPGGDEPGDARRDGFQPRHDPIPERVTRGGIPGSVREPVRDVLCDHAHDVTAVRC